MQRPSQTDNVNSKTQNAFFGKTTPSPFRQKRKLLEILPDIESALKEFDWSPPTENLKPKTVPARKSSSKLILSPSLLSPIKALQVDTLEIEESLHRF